MTRPESVMWPVSWDALSHHEVWWLIVASVLVTGVLCVLVVARLCAKRKRADVVMVLLVGIMFSSVIGVFSYSMANTDGYVDAGRVHSEFLSAYGVDVDDRGTARLTRVINSGRFPTQEMIVVSDTCGAQYFVTPSDDGFSVVKSPNQGNVCDGEK